MATIVIDPGHGGMEDGAVGPTGLREKIVTLDLPRRLKLALRRKNRSIDVVMTRDEDRIVGWVGEAEPPVPSFAPAQLTLTDGTEQSVYVKTDGFLGGIDEEFGTYAMLWLRQDGVERLEFLHEGSYARCPECGAIFFDDRAGACPFDGTPLVPSR